MTAITRAALLSLVLLSAACSERSAPASGFVVTPRPGPYMTCPETGRDGGPLKAYGSLIGDWNASHPGRSVVRSDEYGPQEADGVPRYGIECSTTGRVMRIRRHLVARTNADTALALARSELPPDLLPTFDVTRDHCRQVQFHSDTIAAALTQEDPDGTVDIQLNAVEGSRAAYSGDAVGSVTVDAHIARDDRAAAC